MSVDITKTNPSENMLMAVLEAFAGHDTPVTPEAAVQAASLNVSAVVLKNRVRSLCLAKHLIARPDNHYEITNAGKVEAGVLKLEVVIDGKPEAKHVGFAFEGAKEKALGLDPVEEEGELTPAITSANYTPNTEKIAEALQEKTHHFLQNSAVSTKLTSNANQSIRQVGDDEAVRFAMTADNTLLIIGIDYKAVELPAAATKQLMDYCKRLAA